MKTPEIKAYRLQKSTMNGLEWLHVVYTDREIAAMVAKKKTEEWTSYVPIEVKVRVLTDKEGAIGHDLVSIDTTPAVEMHRRNAIAKLSAAEVKALGL
jgi:hypothetical protein